MERGWQDSGVFNNEPYSERDAWAWMVGATEWRNNAKPIAINNKPVKLKRGELSHSLRFMARKFHWGTGKVDRFIKKMILWEMLKIVTVTETGQNILIVCNYSKYQDATKPSETSNETDIDTEAEQGRNRGGTKKKKVSNKEEERKEKSDYSENFLEFWKSWTPYKTGKGSKADAKEIYLKIRKEIDHETLSKSSTEYCKFCKETDCNTKNVFRWLKKRGWDDDYTIPTKGNGSPDNKASYSSTVLNAAQRVREQFSVREGNQGTAPGFDTEGNQDCELLPPSSKC